MTGAAVSSVFKTLEKYLDLGSVYTPFRTLCHFQVIMGRPSRIQWTQAVKTSGMLIQAGLADVVCHDSLELPNGARPAAVLCRQALCLSPKGPRPNGNILQPLKIIEPYFIEIVHVLSFTFEVRSFLHCTASEAARPEFPFVQA